MTQKSQYYFDQIAAQRAVNFFEKLLHHTKGEFAGSNFLLMDWQREKIIEPLFGWKKRSDDTRRYRTVYVEVPRKNGKSTLSAGLALYALLADNEPGAEVYSVAGDKDQARIVFQQAKEMLLSSPTLAKKVEPYKNSIIVPETQSVYRVLSADAPTKHGLNAHAVIFDELHVQPNRDLWDTMKTSLGSRRQPIFFQITTAGYNKETICGEQREYADKVRNGIIEDPTFLPVVYSADDFEEKDSTEDIDWLDPKIWATVNPGLGQTIKEDYLASEAKRAENSPAYQNSFRRLHLNQWVAQESRWLDMRSWDQCDKIVDPELLRNARCYGGLDLSSKSDLSSFVLVFPSEPGDEEFYTVIPHFWVPEENIIERSRKNGVPYDAWARDGYLHTTPGNVIDYNYVMATIEDLADQFMIEEIAFDRWGAFQVSQTLQNMGFTMIGFGQGYKSMGPPTKELMRLVLGKRLSHNNHPILRWNADNLVVTVDPAGSPKPDKRKSKEKIDGIVALVMGLDRAMRHSKKPTSVYEKRGILTV